MGLRETLHSLADDIADKFEGTEQVTPADELVPIEKEALAKHGLEYQPILRLADSGELRTVEIGHRRITTLRYLLALVDRLPPARPRRNGPHVADEDELSLAVRRRALRLAR